LWKTGKQIPERNRKRIIRMDQGQRVGMDEKQMVSRRLSL
jgi:hypothetical protein